MVVDIFTLVLGLVVCSVSAFVLFVARFSTNRGGASAAQKLPEGSTGWPLIGKTLSFLTPHKSTSPGAFLLEHRSRYGKVFKSHLFGSPAIVSCDVDFNNFILQNKDKLFQSWYPKAMHGILGKHSLLLVSGEKHKKLRNVVVRFVSATKATADFQLCLEELCTSMMRSWKDRKQISFHKEAKEFTMSLMVKTLLSVEPRDPLCSRILQDFLTYMKGFISLPIYYPGSPYAMAVKARARLYSTVKEIMEERMKKKLSSSDYHQDKICVHNEGSGDFLDVIMGTEGWGLSEEEQVSIVLDLLLGGYETTATLMALLVYFLDRSPRALNILKEEHQEIRRTKKDGEPLDIEDYKRMQFTQNVISEALRCGNVVKFLHRKAIKDIEYKGFRIPAGWKVLPMLIGPHLDPDLHSSPTEFDPWRWSNDKGTNKKVMPFGGGVRLCPGYGLALVEGAFFLHHLVLNYRWKTKEDEMPVAHPFVEFRRGLLLEIQPL